MITTSMTPSELLEEIKADYPNIFSVSDTGCGIPKEKQRQVFERFEKLNEFAQGSGLGLSICKLTINKMGGDIWIDPDYTKSSRFCFSHPLNLKMPPEKKHRFI